MSKHDKSWRTLRLNHGLRWSKTYPTPDDFPSGKTAAIIALAVALLLVLIVAIQYQNASVLAVNLAETRANQLGKCIQGTARFVTEDNVAIVCRRAEEFKI